MNDYLKNWIVALRSDVFSQITGAYFRRNDNGTQCYCALGLGLAVTGLSNDRKLMEVCGLRSCIRSDVVRWNDDDGLTFSQIAEKLEAEYEQRQE